MDEKEYFDWIDSHEDTSGYKKFARYVKTVLSSDDFQSEVVKMRKKYNIPQDGFKPQNGTYSYPPKQWEERDAKTTHKRLMKDIEHLSTKYHIPFLNGLSIFESYIFYSSKEYVTDTNGFNLCMISDLKEEYEDPFSKKIQESDNDMYPIAIRISPYASQRDILDFTKKIYKHHILPLQTRYKDKKVKIGKLRKKNEHVQKRNKFIYKNRHLPTKEISTLIRKEFGAKHIIDEGHLGKIISLERKKRKEV